MSDNSDRSGLPGLSPVRGKGHPWFNNSDWTDILEEEGLGFDAQEDVLLTDFGDLENDTHPLFETLVEQPGFQPALRLASKHLEEPLLLPFWHALLCKERTVLDNESAAFRTTIHGISLKLSPLDDDEIEQTKDALLRSAAHIQFLFFRDESAYERASDSIVLGEQRRIHSQDPIFGHLNHNATGTGSIITLHVGYAIALSSANEMRLSTGQKLHLSVKLARTLLHELAPALYCVRYPTTVEIMGLCGTLEPFVEKHLVAELGHAMEICLFGGFTTILWDNTDFNCTYGLAVRKYPTWDGIGPRKWTPEGVVLLARKPAHSRGSQNTCFP
jgi:hypothetical protein